MQPDRVEETPAVRVTLKKAVGDAAMGARDFVVGMFRRWMIYLPFRGAIESFRFWLRQREIQAWMDSISESAWRYCLSSCWICLTGDGT